MDNEENKTDFKGIKFSSIIFRPILIALAFVNLVICYFFPQLQMQHEGKLSSDVPFDKLFFIINILIVVFFIVLPIILHFVKWKVAIGKKGIYIPKSNWLIPWEEIEGVCNVWTNDKRFHSTPKARLGDNLYKRKTLIIYRKDYKPVCVYNISLAALFAVKFHAPKTRTNIFSACLFALVNIALTAGLYYSFYTVLDTKSLAILFVAGFYIMFIVLGTIIMTASVNARFGKYLNAFKRVSPDVIDI